MTNSKAEVFPVTSHLYIEAKKNLVEMYGDIFFKYYNQNKDDVQRYFSNTSSVARSILNGLYKSFVASKECLPLEEIELDLKNKYWDISKDFFTDKQKRMDACKAMYVLDLITGTVN